MDNKSKALLVFLVILMILSVVATFYKTVILQDFEVMSGNLGIDEYEE